MDEELIDEEEAFEGLQEVGYSKEKINEFLEHGLTKKLYELLLRAKEEKGDRVFSDEIIEKLTMVKRKSTKEEIKKVLVEQEQNGNLGNNEIIGQSYNQDINMTEMQNAVEQGNNTEGRN